jgi:hypothetical protein
MDSSDSEDHPGEDESAKYKYVMDGIFLKEVIRYTGQRQIARFDQVLYNFGGNFIPAGQYSFPFSFKTGENYPASFIVPITQSRTNQCRTTDGEGSNTRCRPSRVGSTTDCFC